ncbi:MAG: type II toxin-antitoxin system RelE/ParE family toxin [Candidatus Accumulibacter sp.]|jgi:putative addiction module killer protein|nr:type II toxin-antitoxin system RelE/ParE family toxin [Accumulibacter sp.]
MKFKQTPVFRKWRKKLRDPRARAMVASRLDRLAFGLPGDAEPVGEGVSELRIHYGPGYRVYYKRHGDVFILLLCGGDKSTQADDIKTAKKMACAWTEDEYDEEENSHD